MAINSSNPVSGQQVAANSIAVVLASDQTSVPVAATQTGTWTVSQLGKSTYSAAIVGLAPALLATDIFTITGSATKTVKIKKISLQGIQTTGGYTTFQLIKRSAANTGGTSTTQTNVPWDSANAAATAVIRSYTVNPTALGAAVGVVHAERVFIPTAATAGDDLKFDFNGSTDMQPMVMRGIAETVAVNLNGITVAGSALNISIIWTEE